MRNDELKFEFDQIFKTHSVEKHRNSPSLSFCVLLFSPFIAFYFLCDKQAFISPVFIDLQAFSSFALCSVVMCCAVLCCDVLCVFALQTLDSHVVLCFALQAYHRHTRRCIRGQPSEHKVNQRGVRQKIPWQNRPPPRSLPPTKWPPPRSWPAGREDGFSFPFPFYVVLLGSFLCCSVFIILYFQWCWNTWLWYRLCSIPPYLMS